MLLPVVQANTEFAVLKAGALAKYMVDFFLRNRKSGGFFVLRLFYGFNLLLCGREKG